MQRFVMAAALAASLTLAGCAHLAQPQTWTSDPGTLALQQSEYLGKELVRGLPEETFRRWYTRTPEWTDPLRPSIQETRDEDGATIYEVGTDAGSAGDVIFRGGALDHWSCWRLMQESVLSAWMKETMQPRAVDAADLVRIAALDPVSEPLRIDERPDPSDVCDFGTGDMVETLAPLLYDRQHGNRLGPWYPQAAAEDRGGRFSTLPAGARLRVERWDSLHGRRLRGDDGTYYIVDSPLGLDALRDVLCPLGACVPPGVEAATTRNMAIAIGADADEPSLAILEGLTRIPVWMTRGGILPAGSRVTVRRWNACGGMKAEIMLTSPGPGLPPLLSVPIAPPGLFVPASSAPPAPVSPAPAPAPATPAAAPPAEGSPGS